MSRKMRKIGILMMVGVMAAALSGCRLAKKEKDEAAKQKLYGVYAVIGEKDLPEGKLTGTRDKKGFVHFKKLKGYFFYIYKPEKDVWSMDGDPQMMNHAMESKSESDDQKMNAKEKEKVVSATMYLQEKEGRKTAAIYKVYEQKDGTYSLMECGARVSMEDFCKGTAIGASCSEDDSGQSKITYKVNFKADRAVKKIQIIEMNQNDQKLKKTTYISPKIKHYQMQKDTAYVIINEQRLGRGGKIIQDRKIYQAKKNFTYDWKQLGDDGVLTPKSLKFKK